MSSAITTTGHKEFVPQAAALLGEAFVTDPTITYLLSLPKQEHPAYVPKYMEVLLTAATMNGASIAQIGDWKSCGVLMPAGAYVGNVWTALQVGWLKVFWKLGWGGYQRMAIELTSATVACKNKALINDKKYYYIFFLGTAFSARGQGLCSKLVRHYQEIATKEAVPIWLEAATSYCHKLYLKLGFVDVGEIKIGVGKANEEGRKCVGGNGFTIWGMIWRPNVQGSK